MATELMSEFAVASNGYCFFCLRQIMQHKPNESHESPRVKQINSLQYLTRYLKMDLKKVFMDKELVSPALLTKVERARLKVELCEECSCLSERFSEVYRQLEKLEMELGSVLGLIHGKLEVVDATAKLRENAGLHSQSDWDGLLDVLDVLRAEATQKSFRKLAVAPRVKIQHLSRKEIRGTQKIKFENIVRTNQKISKTSPRTDFVLNEDLEPTVVKKESSVEEHQSLSDNDNGNDFPNDADSNQNDHTMDVSAKTPKEKKINYDVVSENNIGTGGQIVNKRIVYQNARNKGGAGKWSINQKTGKRKCNDCDKEFNTQPAFTRHYQTIHLKLRFKCVACNKLFSNKSNLTQHQRTNRSCSSTGSVPKYNCHLCGKSFILKQPLQKHLDRVHFKLQYERDICGRKFNVDADLQKHRRRVHPAIK